MEVPKAICKLVMKLRNDELSMGKIGEIVKQLKSTVQYVIHRYNELKSSESRKRSGRP